MKLYPYFKVTIGNAGENPANSIVSAKKPYMWRKAEILVGRKLNEEAVNFGLENEIIELPEQTGDFYHLPNVGLLKPLGHYRTGEVEVIVSGSDTITPTWEEAKNWPKGRWVSCKEVLASWCL